jgi:biopolymer transport protein ExbD
MSPPRWARGQTRSDLEVNMTPMIDVVFLLLVFFIWTASFQIVEKLLPSQISAMSGSSKVDLSQPPPEEADFENVVVRLIGSEKSMEIRLNDEPIASVESLKNRLSELWSIKSDASVIVHPDPQVDMGQVISIYDLVRTVGFSKIQFASRQRLEDLP